jgi:hypothetical protein
MKKPEVKISCNYPFNTAVPILNITSIPPTYPSSSVSHFFLFASSCSSLIGIFTLLCPFYHLYIRTGSACTGLNVLSYSHLYPTFSPFQRLATPHPFSLHACFFTDFSLVLTFFPSRPQAFFPPLNIPLFQVAYVFVPELPFFYLSIPHGFRLRFYFPVSLLFFRSPISVSVVCLPPFFFASFTYFVTIYPVLFFFLQNVLRHPLILFLHSIISSYVNYFL